MVLKVKRAMPDGMLTAHETKVRVKSVDSTLSGGTDLDYVRFQLHSSSFFLVVVVAVSS